MWKNAECLKKLQQVVCGRMYNVLNYQQVVCGRMQNVLKYQQVVCVKNAE
jgi:hypothetical protein